MPPTAREGCSSRALYLGVALDRSSRAFREACSSDADAMFDDCTTLSMLVAASDSLVQVVLRRHIAHVELVRTDYIANKTAQQQ